MLAAAPRPSAVAAPRHVDGVTVPRPGIDILHYDFDLSFGGSGALDSIDMNERVRVRRAVTADTLVLDLLAPMQVRTVTMAGTAIDFVRDSTTVRIPLPRSDRDTLEVTLRYGGRPRGGLVARKGADGHWTAFGDNYPDRARNWLATVDDPSDKATVDWTIRHPAGTRAIANGALVEDSPDPSDGTIVTRWHEGRPLYTAVMVVGVAPFAVVQLGRSACGDAEIPGCVDQSVWAAPEVRPLLPGAFTAAVPIVDFFSRLVAPFPYEKLAHVESATRWGGMENASDIFYADQAFRRGRITDALIAHETAHQWFGDAVTTRTWPHVWLSEGFATYFAALWAEHAHGDSAFHAVLRGMRETVLRSPVTVTEPVVRDSVPDLGQLLNSNVYQKAGFVLHMLRRELGDSVFFRGIRAYYQAHRHGSAVTADFQRAMEAASGKSLEWFFTQWMRRPGYAELDVTWRWDAPRKSLFLTVTQGRRFPPYALRFDVDVVDATGHRERLWADVPATHARTIPVPVRMTGAPVSVQLDPDVAVLGTIHAGG